eukprot:2778418-Amphidinium_carterae.1
MSVFRKCLRDLIASKLLIMEGAPSADATKYRNKMLDVFCSDANQVITRIVMGRLPNGDWRRRDVVEFYPTPACQGLGRDAIAGIFADSLVYCMAKKKPGLWPRHRWTGADQVLNWIGLLATCHDLLSQAFRDFADAMKSPNGAGGAGANEQTTLLGTCILQDVEEGGIEYSIGDRENDMVADNMREEEYTEDKRTSAEHSKDRSIGLQWVKSPHADDLYVMRLSIQPLLDLLQRQFHIASQEFEIEQRASMANHLLEKGGVADSEDRVRLDTSSVAMVHCSTGDPLPPRPETPGPGARAGPAQPVLTQCSHPPRGFEFPFDCRASRLFVLLLYHHLLHHPLLIWRPLRLTQTVQRQLLRLPPRSWDAQPLRPACTEPFALSPPPVAAPALQRWLQAFRTHLTDEAAADVESAVAVLRLGRSCCASSSGGIWLCSGTAAANQWSAHTTTHYACPQTEQ